MRNPKAFPRPSAIVLGCGDMGSAVAFALHVAGLAVVIIDDADPSWHRRGMAFTNAWYVGNAELEGAGACFCASLRSIPSVLSRQMIVATTWSWPSVASALAPIVLVDTRRRKRRGSDSLAGRVPLAIGIGEGFVGGENVDVAVAPRWSTQAEDSGPGRADKRVVVAARHGRFMTERRIADAVRAGQVVGGLGNEAIVAPAAGVLLGLAARGARIEPGDPLIEVDPAGAPYRCHGLGEGPRRTAASVLALLSERGVLPGTASNEMALILARDTGAPLEGAAPDVAVATAAVRSEPGDVIAL